MLQEVKLPVTGLLIFAGVCWMLRKISPRRNLIEARQNVTMIRYENWIGRWLPSVFYLWNGPRVVLQNYIPGEPLAVRTPGACYIHFSSETHVNELKDAPSEQLSLHSLSKDMFKPEYTMNGLEVHDTMSGNGNLHTRAFRVVLSSHLPRLCSPLSRIVANIFDQEFNESRRGGDWAQIPSFPMAKRVMTAVSAFVFFGPDLSDNPEFLKAALAYPEDLFFTAEILRLTPSLLHPILAPLLMRNHKASKTLVEHLTPVVEYRLAKEREGWAYEDTKQRKPTDCIQFFVDANSRKSEWTAKKIVQVLLGTWFAAIHQPALTLVYALQDICDNRDYIELLRQELSQVYRSSGKEGPSPSSMSALENAPFLDAFFKESSRLHPSDSISVRRKALIPFIFSDGTKILPGDVACVPSQAIMRDERLYSDSTKFSPWRFIRDTPQKQLRADASQSSSRFTDTDFAYPFWGLGRHSW